MCRQESGAAARRHALSASKRPLRRASPRPPKEGENKREAGTQATSPQNQRRFHLAPTKREFPPAKGTRDVTLVPLWAPGCLGQGMRAAGRSFSCPTSSASFMPPVTFRRPMTLERACGAEARQKAASACWGPCVGKRRPRCSPRISDYIYNILENSGPSGSRCQLSSMSLRRLLPSLATVRQNPAHSKRAHGAAVVAEIKRHSRSLRAFRSTLNPTPSSQRKRNSVTNAKDAFYREHETRCPA